MTGMRFKKFTFNPLSIMVGIHYGRNPVSGTRFLHVAPIPFFGLDFWWPEEHKDQPLYRKAADVLRTSDEREYPLAVLAIPGDPGPIKDDTYYRPGPGEPLLRVFSDVTHEEADYIAQRILGDLEPYPGEEPEEFHVRSERARRLFSIQYPNWNPPTRAGATRERQGQ